MTYPETLQTWRDFYVTAGTAAATLVGLLFLSLSLHIRVVVSHADVKGLARITLADFFVVVLIALVILVLRPAIDGFRRRRTTHTIGLRVLVRRFGLSGEPAVIRGAPILAWDHVFSTDRRRHHSYVHYHDDTGRANAPAGRWQPDPAARPRRLAGT
jgi:hypothetical protein